jgi:hypothetical protein
MKPTATTSLVPLLLLSMSVLFLASCSALAPPVRSFPRHSRPPLESHHRLAVVDSRHNLESVSRRSVFAMISTIGLAVAVAPETSLAAATDVAVNGEEASQKAAAKERMAQRIADSKLKYRKPTDLVKDRQDNTDYSCVSATGSPCPEGLVPTSVQRELIGAFEKLK